MKSKTKQYLIIGALIVVLVLFGKGTLLSASNAYLCTNCLHVTIDEWAQGNNYVHSSKVRNVLDAQDCGYSLPGYVYVKKDAYYTTSLSKEVTIATDTATIINPNRLTTYKYDMNVYTDGGLSQTNYVAKPIETPECLAKITAVLINNSVPLADNNSAVVYTCPDASTTEGYKIQKTPCPEGTPVTVTLNKTTVNATQITIVDAPIGGDVAWYYWALGAAAAIVVGVVIGKWLK